MKMSRVSLFMAAIRIMPVLILLIATLGFTQDTTECLNTGNTATAESRYPPFDCPPGMPPNAESWYDPNGPDLPGMGQLLMGPLNCIVNDYYGDCYLIIDQIGGGSRVPLARVPQEFWDHAGINLENLGWSGEWKFYYRADGYGMPLGYYYWAPSNPPGQAGTCDPIQCWQSYREMRSACRGCVPITYLVAVPTFDAGGAIKSRDELCKSWGKGTYTEQ